MEREKSCCPPRPCLLQCFTRLRHPLSLSVGKQANKPASPPASTAQQQQVMSICRQPRRVQAMAATRKAPQASRESTDGRRNCSGDRQADTNKDWVAPTPTPAQSCAATLAALLACTSPSLKTSLYVRSSRARQRQRKSEGVGAVLGPLWSGRWSRWTR